MIAAPPPVHPWPIGVGPRFHPAALHDRAVAGAPIGSLRCGPPGRELVVHVELFATTSFTSVALLETAAIVPAWSPAPVMIGMVWKEPLMV